MVAKKAVPSLKSLMDKDEDKDASSVENQKDASSVENDKEDSFSNNEKDADAEDSNIPVSDKTANDLDQPGSEVVEADKPVDNQVDFVSENDKDDFGNPDGVTHTGGRNVIDKTPGDMSAETAEEMAKRFGYTDEIPAHLIEDPNVEVYDTKDNYQIPGGTHVHPDVARDNFNRIVGSRTEHGGHSRTITENVYAEPAPVDDKGLGNFVIDVKNDAIPHKNKGTVVTDNPNAEKK